MARTKKLPSKTDPVPTLLDTSKIQKRSTVKKPTKATTPRKSTANSAVANSKASNRYGSRVRQTVDRFQPLFTPAVKKSAKSATPKTKKTVSKRATKLPVVGSFKNRAVANDTPKSTKKRPKTVEKQPAKKAVKRSLKKELDEDEEQQQAEKSPAKKKKPAKGALTPRPNVKCYTVDPMFESKEQLPFVSTSNYSKLAFRAVLLKDANLLKRLIDDTKNVCTVHMKRSVDQPHDPCTYAMLNAKGIDNMVKMLLADAKTPKQNRISPVNSLLIKQQTGQYNFHMLGHAVRPIEMSRGGREGNNAFTKDANEITACGNYVAQLHYLLIKGVEFKLIQELVIDGCVNASQVGGYVFYAVRYGHRKLAGSMVKEYASSYFNELHQQVLLNDKQPLKQFKPVSAKKKGGFNKDITPIHCACINPNVKYLQDLLAVEPDFNHPDSDGWRAIHYAAACEGSDPLSFLLQKGSSPYDMPKREGTALHIACQCGRSKNVAVLLEFLKKNDPALAILKAKSRNGLVPLHLAAREGFVDVVKVLRKYGADVEIQTSAMHKNVNSLMLACQKGHYAMVEHLHTVEGANLDKKDKLKRTALMHAALNGHAHIVSYLLRAGVNINFADSSGNTAIHYAAAYGWYFCLKLLIEAGADLSVHNSWQLTPLAVAYMKGHMGLADYLLQQPGIDINCKDDKGMTLVALTISSGLDSSTVEQLNYLINNKHADPALTDSFGNSPLHHLSIVNINLPRRSGQSVDQYEEERTKLVVDVAKILVQNGCSPTVVNDQNQTPFSTAIKWGKLGLALYFIENAQGASLYNAFVSSLDKLEQSALTLAKAGGVETILHDLSKYSGNPQSSVVFDSLTKINANVVKSLLKLVDTEGATPFLRACLTYAHLQLAEEQLACRNLIKKYLDFYPDIIEQTKNKTLPPSAADLPMVDMHENEEEKEEEEEDEEEKEEEEKEEDKEEKEGEENDNEAKAPSEKSDFDGAVDEAVLKSKKSDGSTNETAFHLALNLKNEHKQEQMQNITAASERPLLKLLLNYLQKRRSSNATTTTTTTTNPLEITDYINRTPLYRAVLEKDEESVKLLIAAGSNVNFVYTKPKSTESADKDNSKTKKETPTNITVLMAAVLNKMRNVVSLLLNNKASIHATDSMQNTALHYACHDPSSVMSEIVTILIEAGANIEARNARLRTPLHLICNADTGDTDVSTETLEYLLFHNADPFVKDCRGRLPFHYAFVKIGDHLSSTPIDPVAVVTVMLRYLQVKPASLNVADVFRHTPLHYAARRGANICCISMLRHPEVELNPKNDNGNTPLSMAVYHCHQACALTLLQANADILAPMKIVNAKYSDFNDYQKKTAWKWAPTKPQYSPAKILSIPSCAVKNEWQGVVYVIMEMLGKQKDSSLKSLAEAGLEHRKYNFVLTLLRSAKNDVHLFLKPSNSWLALNNVSQDKNLMHLLADTAEDSVAPELQVKVAETLKNLGVDIDEHKPAEGPYHPAFYAAKRRNFNLLKFFDENSKYTFDRWMPTSDGHTVFTMLLNKTDRWTDEKMDWLEKFVQKHHLSLNLLTKYTTPRDYTNSLKGLEYDNGPIEQITPLIRVIHSRDFRLAKLLLKLGADVNFADLDGRTPLMHAVRVNDEYLVKLLLDHSYELPKNAFVRSSKDNDDDDDDDEEEDEEENEEEEEEEDEEDKSNDDSGNSSNDEEDSGVRGGRVRGVKAPRKVIRAFNVGGLKLIPSQHSGQDDNLNKAISGKNKKKPANEESYFKKTSRIDLTKKDNFGRTVVHHLVQPLPYGYWENVTLLKILTKNGAPANQKDSNNETPYDIARRTGQKFMCTELERILQLGPREVEYKSVEVPDDCGSSLGQFSVDIVGDATKYVDEHRKAKLGNSQDLIEAERKRKWRPHRLSDYADIGEIVADDSNPNISPKPYSVLLSKAEFTGPYGYYNFYRLQLMKRKGADLFVVFTNWGRIGDDGQYQKTPFGSLDDATKEFKKIFRSKTGNDWSSVLDGTFQEYPKKYRLLEDVDKNEENSRMFDVDIELQTNVKSKLPEHLQALISDFTDVQTLKRASNRSFASQMRHQYPLIVTSLSRDKLLKAKQCLVDIGTAIDKLLKIRQKPYDSSKNVPEETIQVYNEIFRQSLEFYYLLPMKGFEKSDLKIIDDANVLREYHGIVDGLLDYERAKATICAAAYRRASTHPYDYVYKSLECRMHLINPDSHEAQYILHYINVTSPKVDVKSIYKIQGEKQTTSFDPNHLSNHKLLWHGTNTANLISILSLGLLAAPPQALLTGAMFGKGIYMADTFVKSQAYCVPGPKGLSYMLLCEAALGEIKETYNWGEQDLLKNKYDSVKGVGGEHPDDRFDVKLPTGSSIPLGELVRTKPTKNQYYFQLSYNEYICYNPNQVVVRYLVVFE